jgi:hypothetical protein
LSREGVPKSHLPRLLSGVVIRNDGEGLRSLPFLFSPLAFLIPYICPERVDVAIYIGIMVLSKKEVAIMQGTTRENVKVMIDTIDPGEETRTKGALL